MKKPVIIAIVLGVLVIISLVQAFQLNSLKKSIAEEKLSLGSGTSTTPTESSSKKEISTLPNSISNLPKMVGGC